MRTYNNMERPDFTPNFIKSLKPDEIFVFGSNLAGAHGGGAARIAVEKFGAICGQGVGLQGQCYAIPTMQGGVETIKPYVDEFIDFAKQHKELFFYVTRIGCGIAGFKDEEIAPLFKDAKELENVALPESFVNELNKNNNGKSFIKRLFGRKKDEFPSNTIESKEQLNYSMSDMVINYGQVRTMVDILIGLDEVHHFSNSREAIDEVEKYIASQNQGHCSISDMAFHIIADTLFSHHAFENGKLNDVKIKKVFNKPQFKHAWENALYKYRFAKLWKLICYFNEFRRYSYPNEIIEDLRLVNLQHYFIMTDHAWGANKSGVGGYPWYFFNGTIRDKWNTFAPDGKLNPQLVEQYMFKNHEISLRTIGLEATIHNDFMQDACWSDVYFPCQIGTAPIYIERKYGDKRRFIKSCGEGKGPNNYPESLEINYALKVLLIKDNKYEVRGVYDAYHCFEPKYFVPKIDFSLPIYGMREKMYFENDQQKLDFIEKEISNLSTANKKELEEIKDELYRFGFIR